MKIKYYLILILCLSFSLGCKTKAINMHGNSDIDYNMKLLKKDMLAFIVDNDVNYTETDVEECQRILNMYLNDAAVVEGKPAFLNLAKTTLEKLNELNYKCNYDLIETGEREKICAIMIKSGQLKGFNKKDEDFTEEWREF